MISLNALSRLHAHLQKAHNNTRNLICNIFAGKMKRHLWGELTERPDEATMEKQIEIDLEILSEKRGN